MIWSIIHQVLHFLDDPARAIGEAARALRPGGRLIVVDFIAHDQEFLREDYAHRRLGFAVHEVEAFLAEAGLEPAQTQRVPPAPGEPDKLTVAIWLAERPAPADRRADAGAPHRGDRLNGRETRSPEPLRRADPRVVRVLPAQDRGNGGERYGRRSPGSSRCGPPSSR